MRDADCLQFCDPDPDANPRTFVNPDDYAYGDGVSHADNNAITNDNDDADTLAHTNNHGYAQPDSPTDGNPIPGDEFCERSMDNR
ncbi:MAG: hypothetical protein JW966_09920 [Anaerolineae bacterium]|nr:hypothetical protein [Anaerolineae bacterium]